MGLLQTLHLANEGEGVLLESSHVCLHRQSFFQQHDTRAWQTGKPPKWLMESPVGSFEAYPRLTLVSVYSLSCSSDESLS